MIAPHPPEAARCETPRILFCCPQCGKSETYQTEVETREIVNGELVTAAGKAWDCMACHYLFEAEGTV